ncbi:MAG: 2-dehydro-3-deoxygalactonokinase, partial [Planctomycetia bacterium]
MKLFMASLELGDLRIPTGVFVAVDGGTTNTRATVLVDGVVAAAVRRSVGARDVALNDPAAGATPLDRLSAAVRETAAEALQKAGVSREAVVGFVASGMLTSNVGLVDLPHVYAPAGPAELADAVAERLFPAIDARPVRLVRGVRIGNDEMMRGEECETFGLMAATGRRGPLCIVLPGSHTKVVHVDAAGRILAAHTTLAGEVLRALAENTVLAGGLPPMASWPRDVDLVAFDRGVALAERFGVLQAAFRVRAALVLEGKSPEYCAALLNGLVVGGDAADLLWSGAFPARGTVLVGGSAPLRTLYVRR